MIFDDIQNEPIRGLSFWQPFATLMLFDKVETRTWSTPYRGLVLICSTKKPANALKYYDLTDSIDRDQIKYLRGFESLNKIPTFELHGYAIGIGELVNCQRIRPGQCFKTYVDKAIERGEKLFAHEYVKVRRIQPFKIQGSQSWIKITPEIRKQIVLL